MWYLLQYILILKFNLSFYWHKTSCIPGLNWVYDLNHPWSCDSPAFISQILGSEECTVILILTFLFPTRLNNSFECLAVPALVRQRQDNHHSWDSLSYIARACNINQGLGTMIFSIEVPQKQNKLKLPHCPRTVMQTWRHLNQHKVYMNIHVWLFDGIIYNNLVVVSV